MVAGAGIAISAVIAHRITQLQGTVAILRNSFNIDSRFISLLLCEHVLLTAARLQDELPEVFVVFQIRVRQGDSTGILQLLRVIGGSFMFEQRYRNVLTHCLRIGFGQADRQLHADRAISNTASKELLQQLLQQLIEIGLHALKCVRLQIQHQVLLIHCFAPPV